MKNFTFQFRWYWGFLLGAGFHLGIFFICLGPLQIEIEYDPLWVEEDNGGF